MADPGVIHLINLIGRRKHATPMELKSALETGLVESNLENLPGGSGDSAGWRQERASLYSNPTNLEASINRYFDEARAFRGKFSRAGDLAAAVQRPRADLRGKYQARSGDADTLLARLGVGGGSGSGGGGGVVSAQVPQQGSSFDPGPQGPSTLAGLIGQQAPPPVQVPQAPHAVIQSPVVNAQPPTDSGVSGLLDAIRTPAQDLPTGGQQGSVKVSVRGPTASAASAPAGRLPRGTATFDGKPIAAWIKPALDYARQHGWKGTVNEGLRSNETQARYYREFQAGTRAGPVAAPGTSHHRGTVFPLGAVDVSNPDQLSVILRRSPFASRLVWAGAKDRPHFSHPSAGGY